MRGLPKRLSYSVVVALHGPVANARRQRSSISTAITGEDGKATVMEDAKSLLIAPGVIRGGVLAGSNISK